MFCQVYLQPRTTAPAWPSEPTNSATDAAVPPTVVVPSAPTVPVDTTATPAPPPGTDAAELTQSACEDASSNALISAGGYAVGASLLGVIVFLVMRRKLVGTAVTRYLTAVIVSTVTGTTLAALDPARADLLKRCLSSTFAHYVFLGDQPFARAMVLGLAPALVLTLIACLIINRT